MTRRFTITEYANEHASEQHSSHVELEVDAAILSSLPLEYGAALKRTFVHFVCYRKLNISLSIMKSVCHQATSRLKRSASSPPQHQSNSKRSAFGDLTNALSGVQISSPSETKSKSQTRSAKCLANLKVKQAAWITEEFRNDYDKNNELDPFEIPNYAEDIFDYYRYREQKFVVNDYLRKQKGITKEMRAILIDWMVEVQENFEFNHETLYQAVKMVDLYLDRVNITKKHLQLVGVAVLLIASKYDERCPPSIEDFLYICDNAYTAEEVFEKERDVLKNLEFDIGFPLSYRFLRRYARVTNSDLVTLTFARYVLENSLMHYEFIKYKESHLAAAAYLLARTARELEWTTEHEHVCGYSKENLMPLMWKLNAAIAKPPLNAELKHIHDKYSHVIFHEVAKIPALIPPSNQYLK
ncbi:G2/mitotic-specific cyclin-B3 [Trichinella pseudospiralis]|uniref:G2/mitotic-specific cyclin-B3 n=1 Tax=Trichinella pseudospiralis TaxID=6337 RepID=A0A0V1KB46_TRIPS|nr:G2/mitotic-specific cyclin-B3 [Trichinella pseudospiralis]